jgi:hypothetical protein
MEVEGAFGHAFAGDGLGFGAAMFDRIGTFAYEIACGSGRSSRINDA